MMGISEVNNDLDTIRMKDARIVLEGEIEMASKFASTQYVRDYL